MVSIIDVMKNAPSYIGGTGSEEEKIRSAEENLGIRFAPDYRCYLERIGLACFDGHELTGLCNSARLNVVDVTREERSFHPGVSDDWYVIEQANIDGIVIWQTASGEIFQTAPGALSRKICHSLSEYVSGNFC